MRIVEIKIEGAWNEKEGGERDGKDSSRTISAFSHREKGVYRM